MAEKKSPTAQVTLIEGKTYRVGRYSFVNGISRTVKGESNIRYFETEGRFAVRRGDVIRKETLAARKARKVKPTKKTTGKKGDK